MKRINLDSKENKLTSRLVPVRIKSVETERADEKLIVRGHSQKTTAGKYPAFQLELDAEGEQALIEALLDGRLGKVSPQDHFPITTRNFRDNQIFEGLEGHGRFGYRYLVNMHRLAIYSFESEQWFVIDIADLVRLAVARGIDQLQTPTEEGKATTA